jgi:hypothetical protein
MLTCSSLTRSSSFASQCTKASLGVIVAVSFLLIGTRRAHAQGDCEVFCDGIQFGSCPSDSPGCSTPQECLDNVCFNPGSCGFGSGTLTDCMFNGESILPPPVCGNDVRERAEVCDGISTGCDQGFTPCEPDCTCPPGSTFPGECGDNVVNLPDEECDGTDDAACSGDCGTDCTCQQFCEVFCDGIQFGSCPSDSPGCSTPQECLDNVCFNPGSCGFGSGTLTECMFNGESILPPPVCGNDVRERAEVCDGISTGCDQGFTPCEPDCTCPPGSTFPGECGDNVVNLPNEECDGSDDAACPDQCQTDCTCPSPAACEVFCNGSLFGTGTRDTPEECLTDFCLGQRPGGIPACECGTITDCTADGVSVLPPPVCGNGLNEGTEECDPGVDPTGFGLNDCACPDQCQADCTCPSPAACEVFCNGSLFGTGTRDTPEECLTDFCLGQRPGGIPACECGTITDCTADGVSVLPSPVCGNGLNEGTEQCDPGVDPTGFGLNDCACPDQCQADCTCPGSGAVCGNNVREGTEQCDGTDDAACSDFCQSNCTCSGEAVPTVSEWGMVVLVLSLLVGIKLKFGRRQTLAQE